LRPPDPSSAAPLDAQPPWSAPSSGVGSAGTAGGISAGATAIALAAMLTLCVLQLLSGRLSLEPARWRSPLLSFRLERPG
jgi:hypothetical protein